MKEFFDAIKSNDLYVISLFFTTKYRLRTATFLVSDNKDYRKCELFPLDMVGH